MLPEWRTGSQSMMLSLNHAFAALGSALVSLSKISLILFCLYWLFEVGCHFALWIRVNRRDKNSVYGVLGSAVELKHCFFFFLLTIPYHLRAVRNLCRLFRQYMIPSSRPKVHSTFPVQCILESSLLLYVREATELGPEIFQLNMNGFRFWLFPKKKECTLLVEFNIETKQVTKFELNQQTITCTLERLNILLFTLASGSHVAAVHKYQDAHYAYREKAGSKYEKLFLHGPLLNEYAYYFPMLAHLPVCFSLNWIPSTIIANCSALKPPKHSADQLMKFVPHSRYIRFAIPARAILFRLVRKHNVNVDPELLFINSVLHSLDHYFTRSSVGIYLENKITPKQAYQNVLRVILFGTAEHWELFRTNYLVDCKDVNKFYAELYDEFAKVDAEIANWITLSLAF